ncbi:MAG: DPP IV N-terminal domain-containing protein, partial [Sphingomonadales bacterium]
MRSIQIVSLILTGLILAQPVAAAELTIERLVASPSLDGPSTDEVKFSPDGKRVTFLQGKADNFEQQDLWEYNIADRERRLLVDSKSLLPGEEELSEVERARRERQRIYASGIIEYFWAPDSDALLFPLGGDIYYLPLGGEARRLTETGTFETDIKFSPRGNYVSFIRERDLYLIELSSGKETRLTTDGGGVIGNGVAEFAAQEEMDRDTGYWWAPDESRIAYARIDESPVKVFERYELAAAGVKVVKQRYPYAGTKNVLIRLGVIAVTGGPTVWMDLGEETDIYLARVDWLPGSKTLAIQRQSRDQKRLDLLFADASRGAAVTVLTETSETWLNLSHDLYFLDGSDQFLWTSEGSGYRHIYLYDNDGTLARQVTSGDWVVSDIE